MSLTTLFTDIADAIRSKDGTTDAIVATDFPAKIAAIPSGSGGGGIVTESLDPVEVYNSTRPSDWLPMPEPEEDEMYMLFHIPDGLSSLIAFTVGTLHREDYYTVSVGTVVNGQFVQSSSQLVDQAEAYEAELFADNFGNLTSTGMKQAMIRITGTDISSFDAATHPKKSTPSNYDEWNIVDILCNFPKGKSVGVSYLKKLRYFSWIGLNAMTSSNYMFSSCCSLMAVLQLDTSNVTSANSMFYGCNGLLAIPQIDTSKVTSMNSIFNECSSLPGIPQLDTSKVTSMTSAFYDCDRLVTIPYLDTSKVTSMRGMFNYCDGLTIIPEIDTSSVTNMSDAFNHCEHLESVCLKPSVTNWPGCNMDFTDACLSHKAIVDLFNSLPTITSDSKTITLTGNPGVSELTASEQQIATGKNWALTL